MAICNHLTLFQFDELSELGYMGFAIAFHGEKVQIAGTSTTTASFSPSVVEYLHALVRAGKYYRLCTYFNKDYFL